MKHFLFPLFVVFSLISFSQEDDELYLSEDERLNESTTKNSTKELGIDGNFSVSNFGGTAGIGLKLGVLKNESLVFGPSLRYQRSWVNNNGIKGSFSIYGPGAFVHARLAEYFFIGTEFELLTTPYKNGFITVQRSWVPAFFIGGGFSKKINSEIRLNAGLMYDLINHINSPFAQGYFLRQQTGKYIPLVYRIAIFIPI